MGSLPRVGLSAKGEGTERRYFYGSVWAVTVGQTLLLTLWKTLPQTRTASIAKLGVFAGALLLLGLAAYRGALPRTRPLCRGKSANRGCPHTRFRCSGMARSPDFYTLRMGNVPLRVATVEDVGAHLRDEVVV